MLKLLVNAPKGGIGKTTIATNAALLLAKEGKKILACKLSGSSRMDEHIQAKQLEYPGLYDSITIWEPDNDKLPTNFQGQGNPDVVVVDSDDYWKILNDLVDKKNKGWRVIAPIVPNEPEGMQVIPDELATVFMQSQITGVSIKLKILPNKCGEKDTIENDISLVKIRLQQKSLLKALSSYYLPYAGMFYPPVFIDTSNLFRDQLRAALKELGI